MKITESRIKLDKKYVITHSELAKKLGMKGERIISIQGEFNLTDDPTIKILTESIED